MEAVKPKKKPVLNRVLVLFMIAMILANMGGNMYGPLLALYLKDLNANVVQVGLFFTLSQIIPLALQIIGGYISDSLGRLRSIAMGSIAGVISYIGLILAPTWQWVLLGEGFNAVTRSLVGPSFGAFIAESTDEDNRAQVFGYTETIYSVVAIAGPPLGAFLVQAFSFKIMLICAGLFYLGATIIRIYMARNIAQTHDSAPQKMSFSSLKTNLITMATMFVAGGVLTWILITDGARDIAYSMSFNFASLFLQDIGGLNLVQIGYLSSIWGIAAMLTNIPAGKLADRKGERVAIVLGFILEFLALIVFIVGSTFWAYALSHVLLGIGSGLLGPAYQSLMSKVIPQKIRGTAFGLLDSSLGLFSLPAPAIGAELWSRFSPRTPLMITAGVVLLSIIPAWMKFRAPKTEGGGDVPAGEVQPAE